MDVGTRETHFETCCDMCSAEQRRDRKIAAREVRIEEMAEGVRRANS